MRDTQDPPPPFVHPGDLQASLADERLQRYQRDAPSAAAGQLLGGVLLLVVLWGEVAAAGRLAWFTGLAVAVGLRLIIWARHRHPADGDEARDRRLGLTRASVLLTGIAWGAAGWMMVPAQPQAQTFLVFMLAAMAAGSLTLTAFDLRTALGFAVLALVPMGMRLLVDGGPASLGMGLMVLLFVAFLAAIGARAQRLVIDAVVTRLADAARADALLASQTRLQELSDQLVRKSAALEVTLASMDQGILSLGADGRVQVFNHRLHELTDLPRSLLERAPTMEEIAAYQVEHGHYGKDLGMVVDPAARAVLGRWLEGEHKRFPPSYFRRTLRGTMLEVKTRYLPDGGLVRTFTDVTAYFEAQAQTRKLALATAHTVDAVAIALADGIEWVNESFVRMTGFALDEAAGRPLHELLGGPATDRELVERLRGELHRDGRTEGELQLHRKDGTPFWCEFVTQAVRDESDQVTRYITIGRDVGARRRAAAELRAARDEAERASRAKSEFLSAMSHELRTPMNAILGFAQLLDGDRESPLSERQRGQVQQILRAGAHLMELIGEVLDLARVEAGKQAIVIAPVALAPLVDDSLALVRPLAQERGITLAAPAIDGDAVAAADRMRLRQVLLNLLSNAIKYNHPGGSVEVLAVREGGAWRLGVRDTGPGLGPEQRERLFTAFERLGAEGGPVQGAGIGLALSRRMIELMDGVIEVDSEPGRGSTFWLRLPAASLSEPPADDVAALPAPAPGGTCTVLYVEDNPVNLLLMEAMLEREDGVRLVTAALPELGLELARRERPDLVLLDIQLPGMDGYEVLRRLRADPVTRSTPVHAVTANAMPADVERARAAGFDGHLAKPLLLNDLLALVRRSAPAPDRGSAAPRDPAPA